MSCSCGDAFGGTAAGTTCWMYFQGIITICCFETAATVVFLLYWTVWYIYTVPFVELLYLLPLISPPFLLLLWRTGILVSLPCNFVMHCVKSLLGLCTAFLELSAVLPHFSDKNKSFSNLSRKQITDQRMLWVLFPRGFQVKHSFWKVGQWLKLQSHSQWVGFSVG